MYEAYGRRRVVLIMLMGSSMLLSASLGASGKAPLEVTVGADSVLVRSGQEPLLRYSYRDVPFKPYVKELFTSSGLNVLLDAPHDHLHHHGLMLALAVDGVDFWSETPVNGRQKHADFADIVVADDSGPARAGFQENLDWTDPAGVRRLVEQRAISVSRLDETGAVVVTWESRLAPPPGKASVTISGAHYFGLGMRFIPAMDKSGTFRNADNKPGTVFRGQERLVRSNWCAYTTRVDGKDVTVAMFGHPENPRHPATWFMMAEPFAYLSATLGLHEKALEIVEGKPLKLQYAVVLWDRAVESEEIDRLCQQYWR